MFFDLDIIILCSKRVIKKILSISLSNDQLSAFHIFIIRINLKQDKPYCCLGGEEMGSFILTAKEIKKMTKRCCQKFQTAPEEPPDDTQQISVLYLGFLVLLIKDFKNRLTLHSHYLHSILLSVYFHFFGKGSFFLHSSFSKSALVQACLESVPSLTAQKPLLVNVRIIFQVP